MGTSTDGIICFGVAFDESADLPWDIDGDGELEDWCRELGLITGDEEPPVELVNYSSLECPMYILAVPGTVIECGRGYPIQFDPSSLKIDKNGEVYKDYISFFDKYITPEIWEEALEDYYHRYANGKCYPRPQWLLASYWSQ